MLKNFTEEFVMRTAVQLRDDDDVHAYTMLGQVATKKAGTKGEIALFDDGQLVLYIKENKNRKDACLFPPQSYGSANFTASCPLT